MEEKILGQKSFLTPLRKKDIQTLASWSSDCLLCNSYHNCATLNKSYLEEYIEGPKENFKIYLLNTMDNITIGKLSLIINEEDGCANVDMVIAEKIYTGKGYGKDALKATIKYCFEELKLNSIKMIIKEDNMRAEYCCWGCGLKEDKYYIPNSSKENTLRMVIYKKDYIGY